MISSEKAQKCADPLRDTPAFKAAAKAFAKRHGSALDDLAAAIHAFQRTQAEEITREYGNSGLTIHSMDTDSGPDTALVISGFKGIVDIEKFVAEKLYV